MAWMVAALVGCSTEPVRRPSGQTQRTAQTAQIEALANWRADGRVAIQRGDEGWSAGMRWQNQGDAYQLRLIAPLGRGTYQLAGDKSEVELRVPDGGRFTAADAGSLMARHLGWSIPVDGASYWLRGLVAPGEAPANVRRDDTGLLQDLQQAGWRISVLRRIEVGGLAMPSKLFLHYKDLKVRIVISAWKLGLE